MSLGSAPRGFGEAVAGGAVIRVPSLGEIGHEAFGRSSCDLHIGVHEQSVGVNARTVFRRFFELDSLHEFHTEALIDPTERLAGHAGRNDVVQCGANGADEADFEATSHFPGVAYAPVHLSVNI